LSLVALVGWPVWTLASGLPGTPFATGLAVATYAFVIVMAGVVGKVVGIMFGRCRHRRLWAQLAQRLAFLEQAAEEYR
jgi:hypothetical protein